MKKLFIVFLNFLVCLLFVSCTNDKKLSIKDYGIESESEFGGVYIQITIEDFNKLGFEFGDSLDVSFSNGYKLKDQPYYNGYYVDAGESLIVGYKGYKYIKAAINYGDDLWKVANLKDDDTCTIVLNKKGKYKDIQDALNITYEDDRTKYESDEMFGNFRNIRVGNIKENIIYRGASPCDNQHKRAKYVDGLISNAQVAFIMNLSDTVEKIESYIAKDDFESYYFLSLYQSLYVLLASPNDKIMPLAMNMNYKSQEFKEKIASGFKQMVLFDGPYYIHCVEGKDRTGFVCMIVEALMSASYQEIVDDYMVTYNNYYGIDIDDPRYEILKVRNIDAMLRFLINDEKADLKNIDFTEAAKNYLISGGMTLEEVNTLINKLSK